MRVFGIDPGSVRTGYGCVDTDGSRHRLVTCGAISTPSGAALPERLQLIHDGLMRLLETHRPVCVVIENLFHARNVRSALVLGHARGVAVLAAVRAGLDTAPTPHDAADALAIALCHVHTTGPLGQAVAAARPPRHLRSWRHAKLADLTRRQAP